MLLLLRQTSLHGEGELFLLLWLLLLLCFLCRSSGQCCLVSCLDYSRLVLYNYKDEFFFIHFCFLALLDNIYPHKNYGWQLNHYVGMMPPGKLTCYVIVSESVREIIIFCVILDRWSEWSINWIIEAACTPVFAHTFTTFTKMKGEKKKKTKKEMNHGSGGTDRLFQVSLLLSLFPSLTSLISESEGGTYSSSSLLSRFACRI